MSKQNLLQDRLAVDRQLQRHAQIHVVEGRLVAGHVEDEMRRARSLVYSDPRHLLDAVDDLRVDGVDHVDLTALQRGHAGRGVADSQDLDLVGETHLVRLPVVGEALTAETHARFIDRDLVGPRLDTGMRFVLAAIRLHNQVIVREQIWQVRVRLLERDHNFLAVDLYGVDTL